MNSFTPGQRVALTVGARAAGRIAGLPLKIHNLPGLVWPVELDAGEWLTGAEIHVSIILASDCNLVALTRIVPQPIGRLRRTQAVTVEA